MVIDLWLRQPATFLAEAFEEGFRNISWHIGSAMATRVDPIARVRAFALPYKVEAKLMLIDYTGASEYSVFSKYDKPLAVYPTWAPDESRKIMERLCREPVGDNPAFYGNPSISPVHRPVRGQRHRVVVHRIDNGSAARRDLNDMLLWFRDLQAEHNVEIFVSGLTNYDHLFSYDLAAADYRPICMDRNLIFPRMVLPSGKFLKDEAIWDARYKDWFDLIGLDQVEIYKSSIGDRRMLPRANMRSVQWARANWTKVEPFVIGRKNDKPDDRDFEGRIFQPSTAFVLPGARRRVMRNIGMDLGELDRFLCDTCILHNTCTLYREGSVCTVKGAETVSLADSFGTRSADRIIDGLSKLLQRQAERLDDALAAEDPAEPEPDVTRQINSVFANGVKLAKLIDPTLAGRPGVTVNVGVGAGGQAAIVAQQDPRQITARVVAELEASGIPREEITSQMLAGYFKSMGINVEEPVRAAIGAAKGAVKGKKAKQEDAPSAPSTIDGEVSGASDV